MATWRAYTSATISSPSGNMDRNLALVSSEGDTPPSSYDTHIPTAPSGNSEAPSMDRKAPLPSSQRSPRRYVTESFPSEAMSSPQSAAASTARGSIIAKALDPSLDLIWRTSRGDGGGRS